MNKQTKGELVFWASYGVKIVIGFGFVLWVLLLPGPVGSFVQKINVKAGRTPDCLPLLLTSSSLIASGAITGFFRFQYSNIKSVAKRSFWLALGVGHLATLCQFVVVTLLLLTVVDCLKLSEEARNLGIAPLGVMLILLLSMLLYDLHDFLVLWRQEYPEAQSAVAASGSAEARAAVDDTRTRARSTSSGTSALGGGQMQQLS